MNTEGVRNWQANNITKAKKLFQQYDFELSVTIDFLLVPVRTDTIDSYFIKGRLIDFFK